MTTEERFERIEAGIRDLIVVSRTVLNSVEQLGGSVGQLTGTVEELRDAQKHTDEKINLLIQAQADSEQKISRLAEIVDKLTRFRPPNEQRGE
jgi:methyl-accepting chemotaxis protein